MTKSQLLDLYFLDARHKLIDIAAFLDRLDRAEGDGDFRLDGLRSAFSALQDGEPDRARRILESLSDPTTEPIPEAHTKGAAGAYEG